MLAVPMLPHDIANSRGSYGVEATLAVERAIFATLSWKWRVPSRPAHDPVCSSYQPSHWSGLNENIERDGCSMTIQQLCQLPQMVACKLQAKEVSLVVKSLSHDRMWLSEDGQLICGVGQLVCRWRQFIGPQPNLSALLEQRVEF